jgi:16S rRNA (guanine527-N7)-methyltransferase
MQIGSQQWIDVIVQGAGVLGVAVTTGQAIQFSEHAAALLAWNRKINLTAITDPLQVAVKHFIDAIAPLNHIAPEANILDIGTGGGFPGIPLKIMRPAQPITLIDASRKKINFVKSVVRSLQLSSAWALHARAEELARDPRHAQGYRVVICRALADLPAVVRMALPLLRGTGRIIALKGPSEEPAGCHQSCDGEPNGFSEIESRRVHITRIAYQLPILGDRRSLVIVDCAGR